MCISISFLSDNKLIHEKDAMGATPTTLAIKYRKHEVQLHSIVSIILLILSFIQLELGKHGGRGSDPIGLWMWALQHENVSLRFNHK